MQNENFLSLAQKTLLELCQTYHRTPQHGLSGHDVQLEGHGHFGHLLKVAKLNPELGHNLLVVRIKN